MTCLQATSSSIRAVRPEAAAVHALAPGGEAAVHPCAEVAATLPVPRA